MSMQEDEILGLHRRPVDEYAVPTSPRWTQPWSTRTVTILTAIGALLVGFLIAAGLSAGRTVAREQDLRRTELVELINARQDYTTALGQQLEDLRARVAAAEDEASAGVPALRERVQAMELAGGFTRLRGPGLRVTLADSSSACPTGREEDCRIQDADLQLAVNTMFALGAEAVAVNGERVIATTAIRGAGRAVLVNYRVLTSPYRVEAIGDAEQLLDGFKASPLHGDLIVWRDVYGLGLNLEEVGELELPSYQGTVRLRTAVVSGEPQ